MSKDSDNPEHESDIDEKKQAPPIQPQAQDILFNDDSGGSTSSISALEGGISGDGSVDPITEAIRKEILEKQRDELRNYLSTTHPELAEHTADDEKFRLFLASLNTQQKGFVNDALNNEKVKAELENIELAGYRNIHSTFSAEKYPGGFKSMNWDGPTQDNVRSQVVKNGAGNEICTLTETNHKTKPFTVTKQNGEKVELNSYRTIDFPVQLDEKASGTMHLSLVAQDKDGNAPSVDKAVYFTAHYEATPPPNGIPKLKEVSTPQPLKFAGEGADAVGYIEHGGEVYTLPVTRGKYQEMMREVAINKGQSVDISQTLAQDHQRVQEVEQSVTPQTKTPEKPVEVQNTEIPTPQPKPVPPITPANQPQQPEVSGMPQPQSGIASNQVPPVTPSSQPQQPEVSDMPQPQQAESSGIPNPALNAATALSGSMQDLLNYVNAGLAKETENDKKIDIIKNASEAILKKENSNFEEKQASINNLSDNTLKSEDLTPDTKVQGIGAILKTINDDNVLSEPEKVKLLEGITSRTLQATGLESGARKQILEAVLNPSLGLKDEIERWNAVNGITDSIIASKISDDEKGNILAAVGDKINASKLSPQEKNQLVGEILDKGKEAGVLNEEKQQLMQQNLDKITSEQEKKNTVAEIQGVLVNPAFNTVAKTEAIQNVTAKVLDSPIKAEVKGEIIERIAKTVADSSLEAQDKADIVKGVGKTITSHSNTSLPDKALIMESAEKGIAESTTSLEDKKLITKGLVAGIYESKASPEITSEMTKAVASGTDKSTAAPEEKNALKNVVQETKNADLEAVLDKGGAEQGKNTEIEQVKNLLSNSTISVDNKKQEIGDITKGILNNAVLGVPEKAQLIGGVTSEVAKSPLNGTDKEDIARGVSETIAGNDMMLPDKALIMESAEKGIAESTVSLEDKKQMTAGLVKGVYNSTVELDGKSALAQSVASGIDKSTATPEEKNALKDTAQETKNAALEAVLDKETQNLSQDLQGQNLNKDLSQNLEQAKPDLHGAAKEVTDALKGVVGPATKALEQTTESVAKESVAKESVESEKEKVVKETSNILNDVSNFISNKDTSVIDKASSLRNILQSSGGFKTAEEKKAESEQQINNLVENYKAIDEKYKPQYEQQQASYDATKESQEKKTFIENLKLDDKDKINLLGAAIQYERENNVSKPGVNNNVKMLTEKRTGLETQVATKDKAKTSYQEQLKPRADTGRTP